MCSSDLAAHIRAIRVQRPACLEASSHERLEIGGERGNPGIKGDEVVINVGLGSRVLALLDPVSLDCLVGDLLSSAQLLCKE